MKDGICTKCHATDIREVERSSVEVAVPLSWTRSAELSYYICTACGYVEVYVKDMASLPKIAEKYPKIG